MMAQTSDRVSSIAAGLMNITETEIRAASHSPPALKELAQNIRTVAASAARQDEVKGLRGFGKRVRAALRWA